MYPFQKVHLGQEKPPLQFGQKKRKYIYLIQKNSKVQNYTCNWISISRFIAYYVLLPLHNDRAAGSARDGGVGSRKACIWTGELTESNTLTSDAPTQAILEFERQTACTNYHRASLQEYPISFYHPCFFRKKRKTHLQQYLITTGLLEFAECPKHSANYRKHSANCSPSVTLDEQHSP